jgi:hypothetical protein
MAPPKKKELSASHKAAMSAGRTESAVVRRYLDALELNKPRRGRKRTSQSIEKRLAAIKEELDASSAFQALHLIQEQKDLEAELAAMNQKTDVSDLEAEFAKVAKSYSERRGIGYSTWRDVGVDAAVLKAAGISRGTR